MEELQKGTSAVNSKGEDPLQYDGVVKDLFGSWKSISLTEDDTMDFSFDSIPRTNRKTFDFDKMDMDFNLDGAFDKLTSFKVDMPDLDFSCAPKKTAKPKDRMEEESSSKDQHKQDKFTFSFDFNEVDNFSFDSNFMKAESASKNNIEGKEFASDSNAGQGFKGNLAEKNAEDIALSRCPSSQSMDTLKVRTLGAEQGILDSISKNSPLNSTTSGSSIISAETKSSQEKMVPNGDESMNQEVHPLEKRISPDPLHQQVLENLPVPLLDNVSARDAATVVETRACSLERRQEINTNGEIVSDNIMCVKSGPEKSPVKSSGSRKISALGSNECESSKTSFNSRSRSVDAKQTGKFVLDLPDTSGSVSEKVQHDIVPNGDNQESTTKFSANQLTSEPIVHKMTPMKVEKDSGLCSTFFKRLEEQRTPLNVASAAGKKVVSSRNKSSHVHLMQTEIHMQENNGRNAQIRSTTVGEPNVTARELTKYNTSFLGRKTVRSLGNSCCQEQVPDCVSQDGSNLGGNLQHNDQVTKGEDAAVINVENINDPSSSGPQVNPCFSTEKLPKYANQACVDSTGVASSVGSIQRSRLISIGKSQKFSFRLGKRLTGLSSMEIPRNIEVNKDPTEHTPEQKNNYLRNLEVKGIREPEVGHSVGGIENRMLLIPSLKRKSTEASNTELVPLNPLKRLSELRTRRRDLKDTPERVVIEEVSHAENQVENKLKNAICDHGASGTEFSQELKLSHLGVPSVIDDDCNVEKAEAYSKELDDICNMLKKKNEEAKELLVRAIVNNNYLLMLNHPIHDEKIRIAQKSAARLMSKLKELPM